MTKPIGHSSPNYAAPSPPETFWNHRRVARVRAAAAVALGGYLLGAPQLAMFVLSAAVPWTLAPLNRTRYEDAFKTNNFIRRIRGAERRAVLEKLKTLRTLEPGELAAFQNNNWAHSVFNDKDWPYLALRAHLDGRVDTDQASTLFLFWALQKQKKPVEIHQMNVDPESKDFSPVISEILLKSFKLNADERDLLANALQEWSLEKTQFFVIEAAPLLSREEYLKTIEERGRGDIYNRFINEDAPACRFINQGERTIYQLVVPPRLYYEILKAKYGSQTMAPDPILGYSSRETLSDPGKRIQAIPCPFTNLPPVIHDTIDTANPLAMYYHDQGHLYIESTNPHRNLWIALANSIKQINPKLYAEMLDRFFPIYAFPTAGSEDRSDVEKFWHTLATFALCLDYERERVIAALLNCIQASEDKEITLASLMKCVKSDSSSQGLQLLAIQANALIPIKRTERSSNLSSLYSEQTQAAESSDR